MELQQPKLFIQSPPFYYVEVKESPVQDNTFYEESTSVYEISRSEKFEKIENDVILRQLNYFSQPHNRVRNYVFHLENGEKVVGKIEDISGDKVTVKTVNEPIVIDGNKIKAITVSNTSN
ncbi:4-diphosphocytidyl-2C-methyl-D-erythritol kinase [Ureibacillus sp. MALMAid1270]|uniref:4-diphosphocytidyl-2C-methyl-D-erythritol kinase n=1 Tax=Ureibacillus sp. MALMAid1270 TaxID=3411629 RepID=UPI003BA834A0